MLLIDGYRVDAAIREEHGHPSEVTKLPIEDGSDTSDHNRVGNDTVTVEGVVSDTPIGDVELLRDLDGGGAKPSEEARARLLKLRDTRRPVTIVTQLGVYESMAMVEFSPRASADDAGGLFFTAKFEKQRITAVARVQVAVPRANDDDNLGNRPPKYEAFATDAFLHDLEAHMWLDPDLTVSLSSFSFKKTGYKRGVDVPSRPGFSEGGLADYTAWRKSSNYDDKNRIYNCTKGPLRDGFFGTDDAIKKHLIGLTAEQRQALIPPRGSGSKENTAADLARRSRARNDKLRVLPNGDVGTISPSDPRWKQSKPFVPKK